MGDTVVDTVGTWALAAAVILGIVFLLVYSLLAKWWEKPTGRYLWYSSLAFTVILAFNFVSVMKWISGTENTAARPWIRLAVYGSVLGVMLWRGILLLRAQIGAYLKAKNEAKT